LAVPAEIVRAHRVYFEVQPEVLAKREGMVKVGFELSLWAAHPRGAEAWPGCEKCTALYADLQRVARWILPREQGSSQCEVQPFSRHLYTPANHPDTDEICLTILILHRGDFDGPVDAREQKCLVEMMQKLQSIGASEGAWRPLPANGREKP